MIVKLLLFFNLFVVHLIQCNGSICSHGNDCMSFEECATNRAGTNATNVVYLCGPRKVCCPYKRNHTVTEPPSPTPMVNDNDALPLSEHANFKLLPEDCGMLNAGEKITNGNEADPGVYPWMALVGLKLNNKKNLGWICGGSIITSRYILTAAHCTNKSMPTSSYKVRLFEHDIEHPGEDCKINTSTCFGPELDLDVERVIVHKDWDSQLQNLKNDIALLRVSEDIPMTFKEKITPICLPFEKSQEVREENKNLKYEITGWGFTDPEEPSVSPTLQQGPVNALSLDECNKKSCIKNNVNKYCPLEESQICVQGTKGVDVCKGDSGGPLMYPVSTHMFQAGIVSFKTTRCGEQFTPSIFTRITPYLRWILDNIDK